jgi:large subunit ribosomal protein L7/L12
MKTEGTAAEVTLPASATLAISRGSKIDAIKELRAATGLGLREAKEQVEAYIAARPILKAQFEQQATDAKRRLYRWVAVVDIVILAGILWWIFGR